MKRLTKDKSTTAPVPAPIAAEDYPTLSEFFSGISASRFSQHLRIADQSREELHR